MPQSKIMWSAQEKEYLQRHYRDYAPEDLGPALGRSIADVRRYFRSQSWRPNDDRASTETPPPIPAFRQYWQEKRLDYFQSYPFPPRDQNKLLAAGYSLVQALAAATQLSKITPSGTGYQFPVEPGKAATTARSIAAEGWTIVAIDGMLTARTREQLSGYRLLTFDPAQRMTYFLHGHNWLPYEPGCLSASVSLEAWQQTIYPLLYNRLNLQLL